MPEDRRHANDFSTNDLIGIMWADVSERLDRIWELVHLLVNLEEAMATDLSVITQEVAENGDAIASATSLLGTLAQMLRDAATDPVAIQALADQIDSNTNALAAAVVANTPAAPEPPA